MNDIKFTEYLTKEIGIATIPLSPFYNIDSRENYSNKIIRICFAKNEDVLAKAAEKLNSL